VNHRQRPESAIFSQNDGLGGGFTAVALCNYEVFSYDGIYPKKTLNTEGDPPTKPNYPMTLHTNIVTTYPKFITKLIILTLLKIFFEMLKILKFYYVIITNLQ
jgi:hypothetical protein